MFTGVYLCLLQFTYVYHCLLVYVYLWLPLFSRVYTLLNFTRFLMFNYVYLCFPFPTIYSYVYLFTHV